MIPRSIWRWMILDIRRRIKVKRFWIFGILLGICVTAASLYYFFQAEKKEAENRMVKTVNYVKGVAVMVNSTPEFLTSPWLTQKEPPPLY